MDQQNAANPLGIFVGLTTLDVIHYAERNPRPNEKVTAARQTVAAGGPAANAAVVFAALGGEATLLTAIGDGPVAELVLADLRQRGVEVIDLATPETEPAVSSVVVTGNGERSVVSKDATAQRLKGIEDLNGTFQHADVMLVDGHHPELALAAAQAARKSSAPLVIDAGRWKPVMLELLPLAQKVICSADFRTPESRSPTATAQSIRNCGVPHVAVTQGPEPIKWWTQTESGEVEVPAVEAVDTLGAGDAFHGAFAWNITQSRPFSEQLEAAAQIASLRCSQFGPREWLTLI